MANQELSLQENDFFKCPVCLEIFNNPKVLSCGHSFCESPCLVRIAEAAPFIKCPECRIVTKVPGNDVKKLPTNFSLLRAISEETYKTDTLTTTCKRHYFPISITCHTCDVGICKECLNDGHSLDGHDTDVSRALDVTKTALFSLQEFRRMLKEKQEAVEEVEIKSVRKWNDIRDRIRKSADCAREEIDELEGSMLMKLELETEDDRRKFVEEKELLQDMMTRTAQLEEQTNSIANAMHEGDIDRLRERHQLESNVVDLYKDVLPAYGRPTPTRSRVIIYLPNEMKTSLGDLKLAPLPPQRRPPTPPILQTRSHGSVDTRKTSDDNFAELPPNPVDTVCPYTTDSRETD